MIASSAELEQELRSCTQRWLMAVRERNRFQSERYALRLSPDPDAGELAELHGQFQYWAITVQQLTDERTHLEGALRDALLREREWRASQQFGVEHNAASTDR
jgi:hypothetical protein